MKRAGIEGKIIGCHNFRHTLGTLLRAIGTDVYVAQDLLRHANSRTPLTYTPAVSQLKRDANTKVVELLLPGRALRVQHLRPSKKVCLGLEVVNSDGLVGGPDRDRTDDLFHAMEARSQLRHRPTLRKDSIYSGGELDISQCARELIYHAPVSKSNRVSEHSACAGTVSTTFLSVARSKVA
jgi:hypothetical protein